MIPNIIKNMGIFKIGHQVIKLQWEENFKLKVTTTKILEIKLVIFKKTKIILDKIKIDNIMKK